MQNLLAPARIVKTYSLPQSSTCKRIGCLHGLGHLLTRSVLPRRDHVCQITCSDMCRATVFRLESVWGLGSGFGSHLLALNPSKSCFPFGVKSTLCNDYYFLTDTCMSSCWCIWAFAFGLAALLQHTPISCLHLQERNTSLYSLPLDHLLSCCTLWSTHIPYSLSHSENIFSLLILSASLPHSLFTPLPL
jgi:hypothetical protein